VIAWLLLIAALALLLIVTAHDDSPRRRRLSEPPAGMFLDNGRMIDLYVECGGCHRFVLDEDARWDGVHWRCADCLSPPGELDARVGNVICLDDYRRRAS
jgi:hypothetical protein